MIRFLRINHLVLEVATEDSEPDVPSGFDPDLWHAIVYKPVARSGEGFLETLIFVVAITTDVYPLIGFWLGFKAILWWMVWRNIIQVPSQISDLEEPKYLALRSQWGFWMARRLLTGTALNFLVAFGACLGAAGIAYLIFSGGFMHISLAVRPNAW